MIWGMPTTMKSTQVGMKYWTGVSKAAGISSAPSRATARDGLAR